MRLIDIHHFAEKLKILYRPKGKPAVTCKPTSPEQIPYQGTSSTKSRNLRRRETKLLAKLIRDDILPPGSTRTDLRRWRENNGSSKAGETLNGVTQSSSNT